MGEVLKREIIRTEDGSTTIKIPELHENYHSIHGAIRESTHVFIEAGLNQIQKKSVAIFEMGFGTGLNCLLTYLQSKDRKVTYHTIEKYPIENQLVNQLNYSKQLKLSKEQNHFFEKIHQQDWDRKPVNLTGNFILIKQLNDLSKFSLQDKFDLIYFDAFAPEIQPELWTTQIFDKMFDMLNSKGIIVTYCAKGQVRRNLIEAGFKIERLPGPLGKREMLRGHKP